jgi:hypothetical protein
MKRGPSCQALQLADQAIAHVKEGMEYDQQHEARTGDREHDKDKH